MSGSVVHVDRVGPGVSIQDLGRRGVTGMGLSQGGAADKVALYEAAALLGVSAVLPAFELMGSHVTLRFEADVVIALTGASMSVAVGDRRLAMHASHSILAGEVVTIRVVDQGRYGYVTPSCPIQSDALFSSQSAHMSAGIGQWVQAGDQIGLRDAMCPQDHQRTLDPIDRFNGGVVRYIAGPQTSLFDPVTIERFHQTEFSVTRTANRQGVKLDFLGDPFECSAAKGIASNFIVTGDIQMTGEGQPYVLLSECQTIGGYPRIGTVISQDIAICAQAPVGSKLRFVPIPVEEADSLPPLGVEFLNSLRSRVRALIRDPHQIPDLLSYQLISGVTSGNDV